MKITIQFGANWARCWRQNKQATYESLKRIKRKETKKKKKKRNKENKEKEEEKEGKKKKKVKENLKKMKKKWGKEEKRKRKKGKKREKKEKSSAIELPLGWSSIMHFNVRCEMQPKYPCICTKQPGIVTTTQYRFLTLIFKIRLIFLRHAKYIYMYMLRLCLENSFSPKQLTRNPLCHLLTQWEMLQHQGCVISSRNSRDSTDPWAPHQI